MSQTSAEELDGVKINVISAREWLLADSSYWWLSLLWLLKLADNRPPIETKDTPGIFNDKFNPVYSWWLARYTYLPLAPCSTPATLSIFPFGNPTALSSNCVTSFHSVTRSMAAGAISRYWPPASAAASETAVSSASTTAKFSFDIPLKMRNFAAWKS